jgi:hypothetical protein
MHRSPLSVHAMESVGKTYPAGELLPARRAFQHSFRADDPRIATERHDRSIE